MGAAEIDADPAAPSRARSPTLCSLCHRRSHKCFEARRQSHRSRTDLPAAAGPRALASLAPERPLQAIQVVRRVSALFAHLGRSTLASPTHHFLVQPQRHPGAFPATGSTCSVHLPTVSSRAAVGYRCLSPIRGQHAVVANLLRPIKRPAQPSLSKRRIAARVGQSTLFGDVFHASFEFELLSPTPFSSSDSRAVHTS
ncbi:hypothetical protein CDD83_7504 [Cordyceps sp. RAO-2017]|nr:hypothetical protein CDD83_7504 [Cordyceps sp. RAO-2017]